MTTNHIPDIFCFGRLDVRVVTIGGDPWFLAKDVCAALGLPTDHVRRNLPDRQVSAVRIAGQVGRPMLLVNEGGLYTLTMRSRKPEAKRFQAWVTDVVLPAIRKDGGYIMGEEKLATGEMSEDELMTRALVMAQRKLERLSNEVARLSPFRVSLQAPGWPYSRYPCAQLFSRRPLRSRDRPSLRLRPRSPSGPSVSSSGRTRRRPCRPSRPATGSSM